jgi:4-oxalocrotonate tautomerase
MPVVKIDLWEGRTNEVKEKLIREVTEAVSKSLGISKEHVTIIINDVPKSNWGIQGEQVSKMEK